ncbi:uncharacterized protein LOC144123498 [Amblyomma americanum]
MATRQRPPGTASHTRRRRRQQQAQRRRAQQMTPHIYDPEYDEQDFRAETRCGNYEAVLPWPAIVPPFYYWPQPPADFPEDVLPLGTYEHDEYFDPSCGLDPADSSDFDPQDELVLYDYDLDMLQRMEYARSLEPSDLPGLYADDQEEEDSGMGEPHADSDDEGSPPHVMSTVGCGDANTEWAPADQDPRQSLLDDYYGPVLSSYSTVSVLMKHRVRVDISVDRAVRVVNFAMQCTAALGSSGERSCVCHPCGRVLQEPDDVHMATGIRLAKVSCRGVTFTALNHGLVYLVDASGTKSTTERFLNLGYDLPLSVLDIDQEPSSDSFNECFGMVIQARHRTTRHGDEIWTVGGVRVKQTPWGDVQVACGSVRRVIWTSPTAGTMSVNTSLIKVAMSCDPSKFFFVRMGQKRICANEDGFVVRNGSQRAGFDCFGQLILP